MKNPNQKKLSLIGYSPAGHRGFIYLKREEDYIEEHNSNLENTPFLFKTREKSILTQKNIDNLMSHPKIDKNLN